MKERCRECVKSSEVSCERSGGRAGECEVGVEKGGVFVQAAQVISREVNKQRGGAARESVKVLK